MTDHLEIKRALSKGMKTLMSTQKFDEITVADICDASAVSRRTFYRHFADKYALLNWVHYDDFCRFFDDKTTPHALEILPSACEHLYRNRMFYIHAFDVSGPGAFREFCIERLYIYLERDFGSACDTDEERKFYISRILEALFDHLQNWLRSEPCMPPEDFARQTIRSLTRFSTIFAAVSNVVSDQMGLY